MAKKIYLPVNFSKFLPSVEFRKLDNARLYVGKPNQDPRQYPVDVFLDSGLTIYAPSFLTIKNGFIYHNGNIVDIYVADELVSLLLLDVYGRQLLYIASETTKLTCDVPSPTPTSYTSTQSVTRSGSFTRNNCQSGETTNPVFFSKIYEAVATSDVSQADADTKALNQANALADSSFSVDGQAYANEHGVCVVVSNCHPVDIYRLGYVDGVFRVDKIGIGNEKLPLTGFNDKDSRFVYAIVPYGHIQINLSNIDGFVGMMFSSVNSLQDKYQKAVVGDGTDVYTQVLKDDYDRLKFYDIAYNFTDLPDIFGDGVRNRTDLPNGMINLFKESQYTYLYDDKHRKLKTLFNSDYRNNDYFLLDISQLKNSVRQPVIEFRLVSCENAYAPEMTDFVATDRSRLPSNMGDFRHLTLPTGYQFYQFELSTMALNHRYPTMQDLLNALEPQLEAILRAKAVDKGSPFTGSRVLDGVKGFYLYTGYYPSSAVKVYEKTGSGVVTLSDDFSYFATTHATDRANNSHTDWLNLMIVYDFTIDERLVYPSSNYVQSYTDQVLEVGSISKIIETING